MEDTKGDQEIINNSAEIGVGEPPESLRHYIAITRKGITRQELLDSYTDWVKDETEPSFYDTNVDGYNGPRFLAEMVAESVSEQKRGKYEILDIGAGTGLVAKELLALGFPLIDAIDPSESMLRVAKTHHRYRKYFCQFVTDQKTAIEDDTYDVVVSCGAFCEGHIPCAALNEFIRVVKPGGFVFIVTRLLYIQVVEEYRDRLEHLMKQLERDGKWECKVREVFPDYAKESRGIAWKFRVL